VWISFDDRKAGRAKLRPGRFSFALATSSTTRPTLWLDLEYETSFGRFEILNIDYVHEGTKEYFRSLDSDREPIFDCGGLYFQC
jgi:hypothetical protein